MKYSQFNIVIPLEDDKVLIYNTYTGSIAKLSRVALSVDNEKLLSSGFVVADDENELDKYKLGYYGGIFSNKDINLTIATTMSCNLRCPYCFEEGGKSDDILSRDVEDAIINFLLAKKDKRIFITWFGGEPLMNFDSIARISEVLNKEDIHFSASIITNGTLFTTSKINKLDDYHIQDIQITLDGPQPQHDQKRFFKNHQGTFALIINNVNKLLENSNATITLKTNIDYNNASSYLELKDYLTSLFEMAIHNGRLALETNSVKNRTDFSGSQSCMTEKDFFYYKHNELGESLKIPFRMGACPLRSITSFVLGPDGNIYKCLEHLGHKAKSIGNIKNGNYSLSKMAHCVFMEDPFLDTECRACCILPICGGGCPIDREKKKEGKLSTTCSFLKNSITDILKEIYG